MLGYTFLVERNLLAQAKNFTVDMSYVGFHVSSDEPVSTLGNCGGTGSAA